MEASLRFFQEIEGSVKDSTYKFYLSQAKVWHSFVVGMYLDEIDETFLTNFVTTRRKAKVSPATIRHELSYMSALLTKASKGPNGPKVNVVKDFDKKGLRPNERVRFLTRNEYKRILSCARTEMQRTIIILAVETGLRKGEMIRLKWVDIDLHRRELHVVLSKNGRRRTIPLSLLAYRTLCRHIKKRTCEHVFFYEVKRKQEFKPYTNFDNWWDPLLKRAGIEDFHFHDLRHTFASRWVQRDGSDSALQMILGHSSPDQTARYAHLRTSDLHRKMHGLTRGVPNNPAHNL